MLFFDKRYFCPKVTQGNKTVLKSFWQRIILYNIKTKMSSDDTTFCFLLHRCYPKNCRDHFQSFFFFERSQIFFFSFFHHLQTFKPGTERNEGEAVVERSGGVWRFGDGGKKKKKKFVIAQKKKNAESDHGSFLDTAV